MTLSERFNCWKQLVEKLQSTNSIVEKRIIVNNAPDEMQDDIQYIFEVLAGQHKYGFTFYSTPPRSPVPLQTNWTIKEYLEQLEYCNFVQSWSVEAISHACGKCYEYSEYVEPIANRTLKLGIGKSVLPKDGLGAMLGKSYEGQKLNSMLYVTEKLDGNRCIARWDGMKWVFTSRNGKPMKVNFVLNGLPKEYIYDGEVMTSEALGFNNTSGLINSKYGDKSGLVYNIFDIMYDNVYYEERRDVLDVIESSCKHLERDWKVIPVLACWNETTFNERAVDLLDKVVRMGGEGLMINTARGFYQHKRTNDLLKFKKVQTMDMYVTGITEGTGKYEGLVGALECGAKFDDGTYVMCQVGTGLSDEQRWAWSLNPNSIVGKVVEVAYFSKSQNKSTDGSTYYSLRFPRFKKVRDDKMEVSKY